jgi:metallo-beta-lactamase class B
MIAKYALLKPGGPNPFIDPVGYQKYIADRERAFRDELKKQHA